MVASNRLKIIATEQNLDALIAIDGFDFPVRIHGQVDRIDELNGITRIIDYKSGMVTKAELKTGNLSEITAEKYSKAIQVFTLCFFICRKTIQKSQI